MKLSEIFNPHNVKHVRAWKHVEEHGCWSEDFENWMVENNIEKDCCWCLSIIYKMAKAWESHIIEEFDNE